MTIKENIKQKLKKFRISQPFNLVATSSIRWLVSLTGRQSEFLIKHLHRIDLVETKLPNGHVLKLNSKGDDWVSNQVFWRGWQGYEPETARLFFRLAEQANVVFDVGAYVGFFTLLAAHANPDAKVFAFEPMTAIFQRLANHIELNSLSNAVVTNGAVGAEPGEAEFFHIDGLELPTSSSLSFEFMKAGNPVSTRVKVYQLDDFVKVHNIKKVDLMKVDTETTEPEVLKGTMEILRSHRPDIICEVLYGRAEGQKLQDILEPLGYKFFLLTPEGPVEHSNIEGHPEFLNYLFTHRTAQELTKFYN